MIFSGLVLEDFGSRWETWLDSRANKTTSGRHTQDGFAYLRTSFSADPIGRRFARTLVMRLKFDTGVAFAMMSAGLGLAWLVWLGVDCKTALPFFIVIAAFVLWALAEASQTHQALADTRAELLKEIRVVR